MHVVSLFAIALILGSPLTLKLNAAPNLAWLTDLKQGLRQARQKNQPIVLDFYVDWCSYCRKLQRNVYPDTRVQRVLHKFIRVRINAEKERQLAARYKIRSFPTIILLDSNGSAALDRINGFVAAPALTQRMEQAHKLTRQETQFQKKLAQWPHSVKWNYTAGVYYFERQDYARAYKYFRKAWQSSTQIKQSSTTNMRQKKRKALYNTAISAMHLENYAAAVYHWRLYLRHYRQRGHDYNYARYYRGLSLFYQGQVATAREDLQFASKHLPHPEDRRIAQNLLRNQS